MPGLNVTQTSARDINITSRGATSTLSTSQLALVDGRSIYLDFFGFVAWDFLPVNPGEIKQIEVIRGPASAIWGANAMNGVVNVITKSPRELQGAQLHDGRWRLRPRRRPTQSEGTGSLFYVNGSHAEAVNDRWAYKVSAGVYTQDAAGAADRRDPERHGHAVSELRQPGHDAAEVGRAASTATSPTASRSSCSRAVSRAPTASCTAASGRSTSTSGTVLGYAKVNYTQERDEAELLHQHPRTASATNLLAVDPTGQPLLFDFKSKTFDVEFGNVQTFGQRHVVSYGGNFRHSNFDLTIAPQGDNRNEGGAYGQDEIFLGKYFRVARRRARWTSSTTSPTRSSRRGRR